MRVFALILALSLTSCAAEPEALAQITSVDELLTEIKKQAEDAEPENQARETDSWVTVQRLPRIREIIDCHGIAKQGGLVVCQTRPNARVEVGRSENDTYTQTADKNGVLLVGFDRDEPAAFVRVGDARIDFDIAPREYDTSRIDGLPKKFVSEYTAEQLKQIRAASALKKVGFASKVEEVGFKDGFIYPVTTHTKTTNFGAQRILNGDPKRPHFGVDLAAPKGTPILAPADGIVSLASEEMYFEGSLIMIDHGQGLISYYLHNEDVMVEEGQRVVQGEQIGTVGSRGRSTGPHLCWRLKWRGRNLDPELLTTWPVKDAQ
jgi:murein DD-endopeptidase MepM/ murein hydrolase activator NlpD